MILHSMNTNPNKGIQMNRMFGLFLACLIGITGTLNGCACETIEPGTRGVKVDMGKVEAQSLAPGFYTAAPWVNFHKVSTRQQRVDVKSDCMASDRQHTVLELSVLWHIPDANVVKIFTDFHGEPFEVLVAPRLQEAVKEATHRRTVDEILAQREAVKTEVFDALKRKVGDTVIIDDVMVANVAVSAAIQQAIEASKTAQQNIATAEQQQAQAKVDAETARIKAQGVADAVLIAAKAEAKSIEIRGDALRSNSSVVELELIEKWDGVAPQIVGGGASGPNIILPAMQRRGGVALADGGKK